MGECGSIYWGSCWWLFIFWGYSFRATIWALHIELTRRQYSGNEHNVIRGIGLVNCVYVNPENHCFWVIDYRIYDPDGDGPSKIDHLLEMLQGVVSPKGMGLRTVLMDTWSASQKVMQAIDRLGTIYYWPFKKNRLVDDSEGKEDYKSVESLSWTRLRTNLRKNY